MDEARKAPPVQIAKQGAEARDWSWVEASVWTDRMLSALENGVKGGVWYSVMDKVYAPATLAAPWTKVKPTAARRAWTGRASNGSRRTPTNIWRSFRERCGREITVRRRSGAWRSRKGMAGCGRWGFPRSRSASPKPRSKFVLEPILEARFHATSPDVEVAANVPDSMQYYINYSNGVYSYDYTSVNGAATGLYARTFNVTTGALGAATEILPLPSFSSISEVTERPALSSGSSLQFVEGVVIRTTGKRITAPTTPGESTPAADIGRVKRGNNSESK
jgi:hypothetical protein